MAGNPSGAAAPASLPPSSATSPAPVASPAAAPQRVPVTSRTRRVFGVFQLGRTQALVYASRRERQARAVVVEIGDGARCQAGELTAAQARALARALLAAAEATDGAQRRPPLERRDLVPPGGPFYSALRPSGERVLLPVGMHYDRDGQLQGGAR